MSDRRLSDETDFRFWTPDEVDQLRRWWAQELETKDIAAYIGRSTQGVREKAYRLDLPRKAKPRPWTKDKEADLKKYWSRDLPASQIAPLIGYSRCAVIGKARRLNLESRPTNAPRPRKPKPKKATPKPKARPAPLPIPEPGHRIKLMDLEPHHCRYPYGEPGSPDFGFCGRLKIVGSYCLEHSALCHGVTKSTKKTGFDFKPLKREVANAMS